MFCCADCRFLHEQKKHNIKEKFVPELDCPICQNDQFFLKQDVSTELLKHIHETHMPLNCNKCSKIYTTMEDLLCFSKCFKETNICEENPVNEVARDNSNMNPHSTVVTMSTQTQTPGPSDISMINLKWKARTTSIRESIGGSNEFISDSASSIKNISSISNSSLRRSIDINTTLPSNKGKLVRTTSTPLFANQKINQQYQSTEHLSSILHSSNEMDESGGVAITPSCPAMPRYQKVRPKSAKAPVTPLRHVMSKSIQKALAEHGKKLNSPTKARPLFMNRYESIGSPMDLRMSPVIRRSKSESLDSISEVPLYDSGTRRRSNLKKQSESIRVVRMRRTSISSQCSSLNPSVYETCESVEIIRQTSEASSETHSMAITPKVPRVSSGKMINFFTASDSTLNNTTSNDDVFYTPKSSVKSKPASRLVSKIDSEDKSKKGHLWCYVTSALGYKGIGSEVNLDLGSNLIKRCASFAGSLIKNKNGDIDLAGFKRKRCHTESDYSLVKSPISLNSSKRSRIQGRKPIDRMRQNS